jgi:four helix bundle protein
MENKQRPHKNLEVWKESIKLSKMIYSMCNGLPNEEKFGLISQFKRASVSVALNIAEGAARETPKEFYQFINYSSGSLSEIDTLIEITFELNLIRQDMKDEIFNQINKVSALLSGLKKYVFLKINH